MSTPDNRDTGSQDPPPQAPQAAYLSAEKQHCPVTSTARLRIEMAHYPSLQALSCAYRQGVLTLAGRVTSYYHKQMAQEMMRDISGVEEIQNLIEVMPLIEDSRKLSRDR